MAVKSKSVSNKARPTASVVTERKRAEEALSESEEKFRDLFENANDMIQSVDINGSFDWKIPRHTQ